MGRILDYPEKPSPGLNDYLLVDSSSEGTKKILAGNIVTVDSSLTQTGQPADAKKTGDEIASVRADLDNIPTIDQTLTQPGQAADAKVVGDIKSALNVYAGKLLFDESHTYSGAGNWATVTITPQTTLAIKIYSNITEIEVNVLLQSWTKLTTISDENWHIIEIPSGASNKLTLTYRGSSAVSISCIIAEVTSSCIENDIVSVNSDIAELDNRTDNLEQGLNELNSNDYLKIYNITLGDNRAVRFVALVKADAVITSVGVKFDYKSTDNMQFGTWRVIAYGGSSITGGLGTLLYTFSGSSFQKQFDLSTAITDVNSYDYLQLFIDFVYESSAYTDDIVLDNFVVTLNGTERKLYGCNTWTNSQHTANYKWKSDLIPAYARKTDIKALKQHPQLIVSIIDDDTNYCAPTIWGSILANNSDVKIGFACMTAYMNGASTSSEANTQMTRAQLDAFYNAGHEVYSHGWACYSVRGLTTDELAQECWKSKDWLLKNDFIRGSETLVYSGGANDDSAKHNIVRGFYKFGVNALGGGINTDILDNPLYINRVIGDTLTLAQLTSYVDTYLTTGGILVFGFHSYELNKDAENNIQKVRDLITYIKNTDAKIVPLERAIYSVYGRNV